ncbi:hypothetical protein ACH5RR_032851 [Cinchona calisaya]|uniref:Pectinesterase inhibitor domain-containing protein n=1 Tax=Cinchona calisaya TaxID=153742 RepID=A0ABD2YLP1_9GENT
MDFVSKILTCTILLVAILVPLSSCDLIEDSCKRTPNEQLCLSILKSDPKAPGADITGLALIMVNSLKSKATSAIEVIKNLLKTKPNLKVPLTECNERYELGVKTDVGVAVEALKLGNPKFAQNGMNDAIVEIQVCEDGFKSEPSPITGVNKEAKDIAAIASAIMGPLLI